MKETIEAMAKAITETAVNAVTTTECMGWLLSRMSEVRHDVDYWARQGALADEQGDAAYLDRYLFNLHRSEEELHELSVLAEELPQGNVQNVLVKWFDYLTTFRTDADTMRVAAQIIRHWGEADEAAYTLKTYLAWTEHREVMKSVYKRRSEAYSIYYKTPTVETLGIAEELNRDYYGSAEKDSDLCVAFLRAARDMSEGRYWVLEQIVPEMPSYELIERTWACEC